MVIEYKYSVEDYSYKLDMKEYIISMYWLFFFIKFFNRDYISYCRFIAAKTKFLRVSIFLKNGMSLKLSILENILEIKDIEQ